MKNISKEISKLLEEWKSNGFNGVNFIEIYKEDVNSLEDFISDGKSEKDYLENEKNYAIFIAHPDLYDDFDRDYGCKYKTVEIDWHSMFDDMEKEIKKRVGSDVTINHHPMCHEFEIIREKQNGRNRNGSTNRTEKNKKG
jgi:hypothetical protein